MDFFKRLSQTEKRLTVAGAVCVLVSVLLLAKGEDWFWGNGGLFADNQNSIGKISSHSNDTRHRTKEDIAWFDAKDNQGVQIGDSVFAGEKSEATVKLNDGSEVQIGENSLVVFNQIGKEKFADLTTGSFKVSVNGSMKIAVGGKMTTIEGDNSEVQVTLSKTTKPQFKLIKGNAAIATPQGKKKLDTRTVASLEEPAPAPAPVAAAPVPPPAPEVPDVLAGQSTVNHFWHLYELYDKNGATLTEKAELPKEVAEKVHLTWNQKNAAQKAKIAVKGNASAQADFYEATNGALDIPKAAVGNNLWQVSLDSSHWSKASGFTVVAGLLPNAEPQVVTGPHEIVKHDEHTAIAIQLKSPVAASGYIVEASAKEGFDQGATASFWATQPNLRLTVHQVGTYYYRFRTVDTQQQLSDWSHAEKFNVTTPPPAPKLAVAPPPPPAPKPVPVVKRERKPAQVENSLAAKAPEQTELVNEKWNSSTISVQGMLWTIQSSQQYYQNASAPVDVGIGVHGMKWWEHGGVEGEYKMGVMALTSSGGGTSVKDVEARYHYRWVTGFPFNLFTSLQSSVFAGYEMYSNAGTLYASKYGLVKLGTRFEFPFWRHWMSGGEFVYGTGSDGSTMQEISGHLSYFLNKKWAIDGGYRVHLFSAGSLASSPGGYLPYREGYTEGFSALDYHF